MERRGLGRGLASLIPSLPAVQKAPSMRPVEEGSGIRRVPIARISPNPDQPRKKFDAQGMKELIHSIREKGMLLPLLVSQKGDSYELISGERRLRAAREAGLGEVPVIVRGIVPEERLELALIENIQRADLGPIEEASAYEELMERFGFTQEQVADKVGKERATVANLLRLLKLPVRAREALESGRITVGHARAILAVPEVRRQLYFVEKIAAEGWSVRELETRISAGRASGLKGRVKNLKRLSPQLVEILDKMRRVLGTQVRIIPSAAKKGRPPESEGKILIEYYSQDDLNRVYQVIVHETGS